MFRQLDILTIGKKYRLNFDAEVISGTAKMEGAGGLQKLLIDQTKAYGFEWIADSTNLIFNRLSEFSDIYLDNISVKEITDDTDIPRINYEDFSYEDVLGEELVVNGGFDDGSTSWNVFGSGITITDKADFNTSGSDSLVQLGVLTNGKSYKATFDILSADSGDISVYTDVNGYIDTFSTIGTKEVYFTYNGTNQEFRLRGTFGVGFIGSIDNVSVKEVTQQVVEGSGTAHWLLEPESTNLITYSEDFRPPEWSEVFYSESSAQASGRGTWITNNSEISPDGNNNATLVRETSDTSNHRFYENVSVGSSGSTLTYSLFAKSYSGDRYLSIYDTSNGHSVFDLEQGIVVNDYNGGKGDIESIGNGWYRCSMTTVITGTSCVMQIRSVTKTDETNSSHLGSNSSGFYIWGAQMEQKPYATSYIPNYGNALGATRAAESLGNSQTQFILEIKNATNFTFFYETAVVDGSANSNDIFRVEGANGSQLFGEYQNSGRRIFFMDNSLGSRLISQEYFYDANEFDKIAWVVDNDNLTIKNYINGELHAEANLTEVFVLDNYRLHTAETAIKYKQLIMYPKPLTDAELECLTS